MNPRLYAFIVSSPGGVSRLAVEQWALRQALNPRSVLRDVERAAARGVVSQRSGAIGRPARDARVVTVYFVPRWHGEQSA
jgi:hypothetical protein